MLHRLLSPENLGAVRVGIASHNLFDLAYGLLLAESRRGYQNLCRLITRMKLRTKDRSQKCGADPQVRGLAPRPAGPGVGTRTQVWGPAPQPAARHR